MIIHSNQILRSHIFQQGTVGACRVRYCEAGSDGNMCERIAKKCVILSQPLEGIDPYMGSATPGIP